MIHRLGMVTIHEGDVMDGLAAMADESVHCVVTSPPYWGLRDYGVEGQIGLESTPEDFVLRLVAVFREVRRVLRSDGVCWVNMGDSYAREAAKGGSGPGGKNGYGEGYSEARSELLRKQRDDAPGMRTLESQEARIGAPDAEPLPDVSGLRPKDLVGIPWRLAFALQADGWWLRSDCIWSKPNPMPESVTDRPTKAHEYVFLLTKSARYWWDQEAVREPHQDTQGLERFASSGGNTPGYVPEHQGFVDGGGFAMQPGARTYNPHGRNIRTVWTIATDPTKDAHFATFPRKLVERCIKAGCPAGGIVLDPFLGSGTTAQVAIELGRSAVGCELNPKYVEIARRRFDRSVPLFTAQMGGPLE